MSQSPSEDLLACNEKIRVLPNPSFNPSPCLFLIFGSNYILTWSTKRVRIQLITRLVPPCSFIAFGLTSKIGATHVMHCISYVYISCIQVYGVNVHCITIKQTDYKNGVKLVFFVGHHFMFFNQEGQLLTHYFVSRI